MKIFDEKKGATETATATARTPATAAAGISGTAAADSSGTAAAVKPGPAAAAASSTAAAGIDELATGTIGSRKQRPASAKTAGVAPAPASAPPPPALAQRQLRPKVTHKPRVVESSSGSDDEFQNEKVAEETDSGEDEIEESDAAANRRIKRKRDNTNRAQGAPQRANLRATPCARCVRLGRDCWEQVNGKTACYDCGKGKVRCNPEDEDQVLRKKAKKGSARRKTKRTRYSSEESGEESPRRLTRREKGKGKGEFIHITIENL